MPYKIELKDVREAYIKLKSHVYYDTSDIFIRKQIAKFETNTYDDLDDRLENDELYREKHEDPIKDFCSPRVISDTLEQKFTKIADSINNYKSAPSFFDTLMKKMKINFLPKKYKETDLPKNFISNVKIDTDHIVDRISAFIDVPTELHIICVLWIMKYGKYMDKKLEPCCYGNRLQINKDKTDIIKGSALYKPYHKQYQKWRDNALDEAKRQLSIENEILFINLDIKDYYYSLNINTKNFGYPYNEEIDSNLLTLFKRIHEEFTDKIKEYKQPIDINNSLDKNEVILPIGLLSSYILGNWYLKEFDNKVINTLKPSYYGRYVDDMIFVIKRPQVQGLLQNETFLRTYFEKEFVDLFEVTDIPDIHKEKQPTECIKFKGYPNLICQKDKTLFYHFSPEGSHLIIDKLKRDLENQASEFRDFPEEEDYASFEENAYHLMYDGSEGKLKTLKDYKENKLGLSVFFAQRIFASLRFNEPVNGKESATILSFFQGQTCVVSYRLWEKILTYFLVRKDCDSFVKFYIQCFNQIDKIDFINSKDEGKIGIACLESFHTYLDNTLEIVLTLNPSFFEKDKIAQRSLNYFQNTENQLYSSLTGKIEATNSDSSYIYRYRLSNLLRHHYIPQPLLNYTEYINKKTDLTETRLPNRGTN